MTIPQVAAFLGLKESTIRVQISNGKIAATKPGRDWQIERSEAIRYQDNSLGKPGRKRK